MTYLEDWTAMRGGPSIARMSAGIVGQAGSFAGSMAVLQAFARHGRFTPAAGLPLQPAFAPKARARRRRPAIPGAAPTKCGQGSGSRRTKKERTI